MDIEIEKEPLYYEPRINENGFFVDYYDLDETIDIFEQGIMCTCGSRKEHTIIRSLNAYRQHIKSKSHQKWIHEKNKNIPNYYQENLILKERILGLEQQNQHLIYLLQEKDYYIQYLQNGCLYMNQNHC